MLSCSVHYFASILNFLETQNVNTDMALSKIKLVDFDVNNDQQRVSLIHYNRLLSFGENELGQTLFGFNVGKNVKAADYGVLGYLIETSKDLASAIDALLKYDSLVADIGKAEFSQNREFASISWQADKSCNKQVILRNMTSWVATARQILSPSISASKMYFTDTFSTKDQNELMRWFNCPISFNAKENKLEFPISYLDMPLPNANPMVFNSLKNVSETALGTVKTPRLVKYISTERISLRIENLLQSKAELFEFNQTTIAQNFNLSPRSLQRKLKFEGTSFSELLDKERKKRALKYLGLIPIGDIAVMCGFSEQSSFNKAFHRWFSCSPSQYLKQNLHSSNKSDY